jgi:hypothetical protein
MMIEARHREVTVLIEARKVKGKLITRGKDLADLNNRGEVHPSKIFQNLNKLGKEKIATKRVGVEKEKITNRKGIRDLLILELQVGIEN